MDQLVLQLITAVTTLITMVGGLQADVNALKAKAFTGPTFGAVSVLSSPLEVNGSQTHVSRVALRQATSSLASFRSPAATSTLQAAYCNIASGNAYANTYHLGWGSFPHATTTLLGSLDLAASVSGTVKATSTLETADMGGGQDGVVPPNTYINFKLGTSSAITNINIAPVGSCTVEFLL